MGRTNHDWLWDRFCALSSTQERDLVALDYGCGDARLVTRSLRTGVGDFHGADSYYGEGELNPENAGEDVPPETQERIRVIEPGKPLPFDDDRFDFICSNQVFEHIHELAASVAELARITRPGGRHLHLFPTTEHVVEGHLGVPLIHRLPQHRRRAWAARRYPRVRFGDQTSRFDEWWSKMGPFLAEHTVYRTAREYDAAFSRHFAVRHVESEKLGYHLQDSRLRSMSSAARFVPRRLELMRATYAVELTLDR